MKVLIIQYNVQLNFTTSKLHLKSGVPGLCAEGGLRQCGVAGERESAAPDCDWSVL